MLIMNRLLLFFLIKLFERYLKTSANLKKHTNSNLEWSSVVNSEENLLKQCYQILKKRLKKQY